MALVPIAGEMEKAFGDWTDINCKVRYPRSITQAWINTVISFLTICGQIWASQYMPFTTTTSFNMVRAQCPPWSRVLCGIYPISTTYPCVDDISFPVGLQVPGPDFSQIHPPGMFSPSELTSHCPRYVITAASIMTVHTCHVWSVREFQ